ncbi:MAG: hypothetical protein ACKOD2_10130 [Ilumatobacteraceae bacterium]
MRPHTAGTRNGVSPTNRRSVGVIGVGHVGRITRDALTRGAHVVAYDVVEGTRYPESEFAKCDYLIVCVNTPSLPGGGADLSPVRAAFEQMPPEVPVVLRSTVPPGTTDLLARHYRRPVIFWPEYIGETNFVVQTMDQLHTAPFQVVGAERSPAFSRWLDLIAEIYGPLVRFYRVTPVEAEIIKYMENCFFAVKTTFVNEFRSLCDAFDADWQAVREGWLLDPRVERDHSDAFRSAPGYGGKCLPKDVAALLDRAGEIGAPRPLLDAVRTINAAHSPASAHR